MPGESVGGRLPRDRAFPTDTSKGGIIMYPAIKHYASTLAVCGALMGAGAVHATTQFSGKVTLTVEQSTGYAKVCFKETGVKKPITYTVTGKVTANYACRNRGGNCPPGQETTIKETVNSSATYSPDKYGNISACIVLKVPKPTSSPCPDEMALVLKSVEWSHMAITDVTNRIGPVFCTPSKEIVNYATCPKR